MATTYSEKELENVFSTVAKYFTQHCLFLRSPNTSDAWTLNEENWNKLMRRVAMGEEGKLEFYKDGEKCQD